MVATPPMPATPPKPVSPRHALLEELIAIAVRQAGDQFLDLANKLAGALIDATDGDAKLVQQRIRAGNQLRNRNFAFLHLATAALEKALRHELAELAPTGGKRPPRAAEQPLSLVSLEEMDSKVALSGVSKPFESLYADALQTLNVRLAFLLDRDILRVSQNPFRPEVFLQALQAAWTEFDSEEEAAGLLQPMLKPGMFIELGPMLEALNLALQSGGVLPGAVDGYRRRKSDAGRDGAPPRTNQAALAQQLRQFFASSEVAGSAAGQIVDGIASGMLQGGVDLTIPELPAAALAAGNNWIPNAAARTAAITAPGAPVATAGLGASTAAQATAQAATVATAATATQTAHNAHIAPPAGHSHAPGHGSADAGAGAAFAAAHGGAAVAGAITSGAAAGPAIAGATAAGAIAPTVAGAIVSGAAVAPTFADPAVAGTAATTPGQPGAAYLGLPVIASGAVGGAMPAAGPNGAPNGTAPQSTAPTALIAVPGIPGAIPGAGWTQGAAHGFHTGALTNEEAQRLSQIAAKQPLLTYLAELQKLLPYEAISNLAAATAAAPGASASANPDDAPPANVFYLPNLKQSMPQGSLSRADESTIDLLSAVFDTVFRDHSISPEIRELIRFLQIPVLKAALVDKNFFFQEAHPARRLLELLSRMGWEQRKGPDDPLFQAMQRSVDRVGRDYQQELSVFTEAVDELEASIQAEEKAAAAAIAAPIAAALKQEKMAESAKLAKNAVALRIGTGEVIAVVEAFLEQRWVSVLTIAYSIEDDKPGAVNNATRTMDDLIWSIRPKLTADDRKQLIAKLPGLLSTLNKWLDVIKWQDADRLQFFAELAECHASIVRAPLELAPERQLEIAMQVAQQAAERRLQLQAKADAEAQAQAEAEALAAQAAPDPAAEDAISEVDGLTRGMWLEFEQQDGSARKVKLAWISPRRTLYIFSTAARQEAFSISGDELAARFRAGSAQVVRSDGVVTVALSQALSRGAGGGDGNGGHAASDAAAA